jgi:RecA/RadA recombinase
MMIFPTQRINKFFDNSKPLKGILGVWGDFGVGKTILALQTTINTATRENVLFLYTKPSFPFIKLNNIANSFDQNILEKISFLLISDFNELISIIYNLEFLILKHIKEKKNVLKLVVIDSLTDLYHLELQKEKKEKNVMLNYLLNQILAFLIYINAEYDIEILIVNELSRKTINNNIIEVQSGGNVMNYWISNSIKIARTDKLNLRKLNIRKSSDDYVDEFNIKLTSSGFI